MPTRAPAVPMKLNAGAPFQQAVTGQAARTVGYGYDSDGLRRTMSYPGGTVITNTFTARNQLATLTANGPPPLASYAYDAAGRRVSKTLENGTSTTYGYDDANRLLGLAQWHGTNQFAALAYTYNTVGNRTSRTGSGTGLQPVTDTYGYVLPAKLGSYFLPDWGNSDFEEMAGLASTFAAQLPQWDHSVVMAAGIFHFRGGGQVFAALPS